MRGVPLGMRARPRHPIFSSGDSFGGGGVAMVTTKTPLNRGCRKTSEACFAVVGVYNFE
jgi:hypothetical protein